MAFRYLIFLLSLTSCLDEQEIRTSSSSYDDLLENPHYEYVTYLSYENEFLVNGNADIIEYLSTKYNLDIDCVNHMLVDYLGFIRNETQNYSEEFIEGLKYHYADLLEFDEDDLCDFFVEFHEMFDN